MPTATDRPLRFCDVCGGLDDHPRHTIITGKLPVATVPDKEFLESLQPGAPVTAIAELLKPGVAVRHIDCCAAQGCIVCQTTEQHTDGARGPELIDTIAAGALDDVEVPEPTTLAEHGLRPNEEANTDG